MFKEVYVGKEVEKQSQKILILGESHHHNDVNDESFSTLGVMKNFRENPANASYKFFHKIAKSCGIDAADINEKFKLFWDNVYFGNYVEKLCGIKNNLAKDLIKSNRETYNDNLFSFINDNEIDIVLVFSRLVFNNSLPSLSKEYKRDEALENLDNGTIKIGKCRDYISHCRYLANTEHENTSVILNKNVDFYGLRHPSTCGGYKTENYIPYLSNVIKLKY